MPTLSALAALVHLGDLLGEHRGGPVSEIVTLTTPWQQLSSNVAATSDNGFTPATDWRRAGPIGRARARTETRNRTGTIEVIGAANFAQTSFDTNSSGTKLGAAWISATGGPSSPTTFTDLTTDTQANQLARFGYLTRNTSGSGTGLSTIEARTHFDLAISDVEVATGEFQMVYGYAAGTPVFFPVTPFLNSVRVSFARGMYEVRANAVTGLKFAWAYQLVTDPTNPGNTCTLIGTAVADPTDLQYPTGWTTIDPTNGTLIRFGWAIERSSGTGVIPAAIGGQIEYGRT